MNVLKRLLQQHRQLLMPLCRFAARLLHAQLSYDFFSSF
jgi:hypothetical protein